MSVNETRVPAMAAGRATSGDGGPGRHGDRPFRVGVPLVVVTVLVALLAGPAGCRGGTPAQPSGADPSAAPDVPTPTGPYAARVPRFPPAPPPEPVTVPAGPEAGWYSRIPTTQPVAFLTIDDGWVKKPEFRQLLLDAQVPVTLFLTVNAVDDDPDYFRDLPDNVAIEAHTVTHQVLRGKPYATQRQEICGSADRLAQWYGRRPVLFRPPGGSKDASTLRASRDCGMKAAFFWKETVDKGKVRYQDGPGVRAGDIILMHFRERFVDDFIAALTAIHTAGLTPALLGDYIR
ncbi:polysaccharide deacetylase family protein [Plantactinospora soyae]|uniref:Peptidoglycan/xylan/chitin deacetylase (PgdA/CDA1 family) n=1 Tax=Plantactinospora soyae TaxID=1544732 RepID=A0A927MKK1_9ACTN|nr:polysaccharide deacetylase family protein [Plantactinospora soyae]MBE1492880.1 peptidoglycan/xylan/chitin deacetylase (PgdA/CDA1 family) [Plantactinospora soyae]